MVELAQLVWSLPMPPASFCPNVRRARIDNQWDIDIGMKMKDSESGGGLQKIVSS